MLASLEEYVLVAQDHARVEIFRRHDGWERQVVTRGAFALTSMGLSVGLDELYDGVPVETGQA